LPDRAIATGTAIIVAPGGGNVFLTMDREGYDVARWLAARGVAAFVLKYRLNHTPEKDEDFQRDVMKPLLPGLLHRSGPTAAAGTTTFGMADGGEDRATPRRRVGDCTESHRDHGLLRRCRGYDGGGAEPRCGKPA
jgi:hypothetical protein